MATSRLGHCSGNEAVRKIIIGLLAVGFVGFGLGEWRSLAADEAPASGASSATPAAAGGAQPGGPMLGPATPPLDLVASTPKGQLKNPYNADIATLPYRRRHVVGGCQNASGSHSGQRSRGQCTCHALLGAPALSPPPAERLYD